MKAKLSAISLLFLTSCAVGPNYKQPEIALPETFLEEETTIKEPELKEWWTHFHDPDLNNLINIAIENNLDLKIAMDRIEEARGQLRIATGNIWPEVSMTATAIRSRISQNLFDSTFLGPPTQNFFQVGFDAIWELDFFGRLRRGREAAVYEVESEQENTRDVFIILLSDVARTYTDIRALQHKIAIAVEQVDVQKAITDLIEANFSAGIVSERELQTENALLQEAQEALVNLDTALKESYYRLAVLLGMPPEEFDLPLDELKPIPHAEKLVGVGMPSELLRRRPDIRRAERNLAAATARIGEAVAELFPKFSLTGFVDLQANKSNRWFKWASRAWSIGPSIDWPILTFGRIRGNIDVQNAIQKQAYHNYENTILRALEDVENSLVAYFNEQENLCLKKEQVASVGRETELSEDLYTSGLDSMPSYLKRKRNYLNVQSQLIDTKQQLSSNLIALYKALGGGW